MKKLLIPLLALFLCLLLAACGVSEEDSKKIYLYHKYEALINALEDGDKEDAAREFRDIVGGEYSGNDTESGGNNGYESNESDGNDGSSDPDALAAKWLNALVGEWCDGNGVVFLTVDKNGICTANGSAYTVAFESNRYSESDSYIYFTLTGEDNGGGTLRLKRNYADNGTENDISISISNLSDSYLRAADYDAICAEWIGKLAGDWMNLDTISVSEDGFCTIDGTKYRVQFELASASENASRANYNLYDPSNADQPVYWLQQEKDFASNGTETDLSLYKYIDGNARRTKEYFSSADYAAISSEWLDKLVGDWINTNQAITVGADHTCTIDGVTYTLQLDAETIGSNYSVKFYLNAPDAPRAYYLGLEADHAENGTNADLRLYAAVDEGNYEQLNYFFRASDYEVVELTVDNWLDYFEIAEIGTFDKNAFGEVRSFYLYRYYVLKKEYAIHFGLSYPIAIEYTKSGSHLRACTVDPIAQTYTLGEKLEAKPWFDGTSTESIRNYYFVDGPDQPSRLGFMFCDGVMGSNEFENGKIVYIDSIEVNRISGTLYIVK